MECSFGDQSGWSLGLKGVVIEVGRALSGVVVSDWLFNVPATC